MTTHISPPVSPSHPSCLILLVPPGRFSSQEWPTPGNFSSAPLYFTQRKQNTEPHLGWCADVQQMEKPLFFFSPYHTAFESIWPGNNWNQVTWSAAKDTRWIFLQSVNLLIMNLGEKKCFKYMTALHQQGNLSAFLLTALSFVTRTFLQIPWCEYWLRLLWVIMDKSIVLIHCISYSLTFSSIVQSIV